MDFDTTAADLHAAIAAVCPIAGVAIGRKNDKATWRIDFADAATDAEKDAARAALAAFDVAMAQAQTRLKRERATAIEAKMRELAERMVDDPTLLDKLAPRAVVR
jgi:hypothetical protein